MPERLVDSVMDGTAFAASDLIAEANHRIADNLGIIAGLIRAQVLKIPLDRPLDPLQVRASLGQMSLRIDAVGRPHRLLMNTGNGGSVELTAYLRELADAAMCSLAIIDSHRTADNPRCRCLGSRAARTDRQIALEGAEP